MGNIRWYKRDPRAALVGVRVLTLEEGGAYNIILDLLYVNDGSIPNDVRYVAGNLNVDVRVAKRLLTSLVAKGKLYIHSGMLRNERADEETRKAQDRIAHAAEAGRTSARKSAAEINILKNLAFGSVQQPTTTKKERKKEEGWRGGSLATALPTGALREPRARVEASPELQRLLATKEAGQA